jgi:very-short-patch-repair endonuclease
MFTSVFKGRTVAFAREANVAHIALFRLLQSRRLKPHRFVHQDTVGTYCVEFACHDRKLIVELCPKRFSDRDLERQKHLTDLGYRMLRVIPIDLLKRPDRVLEQIRTIL